MPAIEEPKHFALSVEGMDGAQIAVDRTVEVDSAENDNLTIVVRAPHDLRSKVPRPFFLYQGQNHDKIEVHGKATFLMH